MSRITLVTGNPNKLLELQKIFPATLDLRTESLDLVEPQTLDLHEIVQFKLERAFEVIDGPVLVEDISAELEVMNGLPGPFIKFFEQRMGKDALYKLSHEGARVAIKCCMGYYDGNKMALFDGQLDGTITKPRIDSGFGFDIVIIPDGYNKTIAELGPDIKNTISHRSKAAQQMASFLLEQR